MWRHHLTTISVAATRMHLLEARPALWPRSMNLLMLSGKLSYGYHWYA